MNKVTINTKKHDEQTKELYNIVSEYLDTLQRSNYSEFGVSNEQYDKIVQIVGDYEQPTESDPDYFTSQEVYDNYDFASEFTEIINEHKLTKEKENEELIND